jgi:hypothetical protein
MDCPKDIAFLTLDTIAECYDGIPEELYRKLWQLTAEAERAGTAQPLGGDGSNGTTEIPIVCESYDNNLGKAWPKFTPEEQQKIIEVTSLD